MRNEFHIEADHVSKCFEKFTCLTKSKSAVGDPTLRSFICALKYRAEKENRSVYLVILVWFLISKAQIFITYQVSKERVENLFTLRLKDIFTVVQIRTLDLITFVRVRL